MDSARPASRPTVVKIGGSLFDLPNLSRRLTDWLEPLRKERILLVPGGGPTTDVIRELDRVHGLGEEHSHWLALHALAVNAHFLAMLLPSARVVTRLAECSDSWQRGTLPVLDAFAFLKADEGHPGSLPHSWDVTGDSVAARVAGVFGATRLILLKSTDIPHGMNWAEAARLGHVDPYFPSLVAAVPNVEVVNLRALRESKPGC